ncbi:MAG TPA: hypothetical protein VGY66_13535 [Gemmataceae bacterium]|jgi:hypothetical protein|nr:hypothetical protein [Gemmataceae bacterium]
MTSLFLYEQGDRFPILDLVASFAFKSPGSVSFELGSESDGIFDVIGCVDVHHPCEGHIKAQLRVLLPARYHSWEQMRELVERVLSALGIPADETYEASFVSADQQTGIVQATDREGMTDRLY